MHFITKALIYKTLYNKYITTWLFYFIGIRNIKPSVSITTGIIRHSSNSVIRDLIGHSKEFQMKFTVTHKLFKQDVNWRYCNTLM